MKRILLTALMILSGCSEDRLIDFDDCGRACYTVGNTGVGECQYGFWDCSKDSPQCRDEIFPSAETCDNKDNDCDGLIDNYLVRRCESQCGLGTEICESGEWVDCDAPEPDVEICDNEDNDCDGDVDEELSSSPCYPLGFYHESLANSPCTYGVTTCINGAEVCDRAVVPEPEVCDLIDNNCDGYVNEGLDSYIYDVVLILDYSASMTTVAWSVLDAIEQFAEHYQGGAVRIALVGIAGPERDGSVELVTDFVDPITFVDILMSQTVFNGSLEPSYDALLNICDVQGNPLELNWRPESNKVVILFSDEAGQSMWGTTIEHAILYALANDITVHAFIEREFVFDFRPITSMTGGIYFDISSGQGQIAEDLLSIINGFCQQ